MAIWTGWRCRNLDRVALQESGQGGAAGIWTGWRCRNLDRVALQESGVLHNLHYAQGDHAANRHPSELSSLSSLSRAADLYLS